MKHLFPIAAVAILCACTRTAPKNEQKEPVYPPHNRTIENSVYGAKSVTTANINIEKVEITDSLTRLFMIWNVSSGNGFRISPESYIVANGQKLQVLSADSIDINSPKYIFPKKGQKEIRFVLNFQDVDSTIQTIDFLEGEDFQDFKIWNIALNDDAAARIKTDAEVPDEIVREARTINSDTAGLDKQYLIDGYATVIGKIYGYHPQAFGPGEHRARIWGYDVLGSTNVNKYALIADDGTFEFKVPVCQKYQRLLLYIDQFSLSHIYIACDDTVLVNIDLKKAIDNYTSDRDNAYRRATYFAGPNAEINNYDFPIIGDFTPLGMDKRVNKSKMAGMSLNEYKNHILGIYGRKMNEVNSVNIISADDNAANNSLENKEILNSLLQGNAFDSNPAEVNPLPNNRKIIEMYNLILRHNAFNLLTDYRHYLGSRDANGKPFKPDKEYYSFIKDLYVDGEKGLYNFGSSGYIYRVAYDIVTGKQTTPFNPEYEVVSKEGEPLVVERKMSAKDKAAEDYIRKELGITSSLFFDNYVASRYLFTRLWSDESVEITDTIIAIMRTLSDPYYAKHAENIKNGMFSNIDKKSYWHHSEGESMSDSLFVELIKDFEGKVIFIDFWSQTCKPCFEQIEELKSIEKELPMDSIVFINICNDRLTKEDVYKKQSEKWGNTNYRLDEFSFRMIYGKLGFEGYPCSVIINKKGQIIKKYEGYSSRGKETHKKVLLEEAMK